MILSTAIVGYTHKKNIIMVRKAIKRKLYRGKFVSVWQIEFLFRNLTFLIEILSLLSENVRLQYFLNLHSLNPSKILCMSTRGHCTIKYTLSITVSIIATFSIYLIYLIKDLYTHTHIHINLCIQGRCVYFLRARFRNFPSATIFPRKIQPSILRLLAI